MFGRCETVFKLMFNQSWTIADRFLIDFLSNQAFHQQTHQQTNLSTYQPFNKQPSPASDGIGEMRES